MNAALPALLLILGQAPAGNVLTLDQALAEAEANNLDLRAAQARLDQANELSRKAWANYLPQITVGGSYTYNSVEASLAMPTGYVIRDLGVPTSEAEGLPGAPTNLQMVPSGFAEVTIQRRHMFAGNAQLRQALLVPQLWPAIASAYLAEESTELNVENARREILFAVAQLYYGAAGLKESLEAQERMMKAQQEHVRDAQAKYDLGAGTRVALLRAQIELAKAEQNVQRTRNSYQAAISSLATLLNRAPDFEVVRPPSPSLELKEANLEELALDLRPDVQAARVGVELAEKQTLSSWLAYAPSLHFLANYQIANVQGFTGEYGYWTAGLGLSWTIWDGGLREAELRESRARERESRATLEAAEVKARDEVRRALLDLESAQANRTIAEDQLRLAKESATLVRGSYEVGAATYLELIDADNALLGAELTLLSETLNADLAVIKVARAAGTFGQ